jgi:hypothetical protein
MCVRVCLCVCVRHSMSFFKGNFAVYLSSWRWEFHAINALYKTLRCRDLVLDVLCGVYGCLR